MKFLLVDDHPVVRRGVRDLMREAFPSSEFTEASSSDDAIGLARTGSWDVVVLDIAMPRRGGMDVLKEIHGHRPELPVIVFSAHAEDQYAIRALRAGARGYVTKDSASEELVAAVRKALAGGTYVNASLAERLVAAMATEESDRPLHATLSDRELQVLRMLASGKTVKEIGAELSLSDKTISTYRARLLEKMKLRTNAELMRYALRVGLVD
ncbi:MAG: response regulator [Kofleriaceae bacterium]